MNTMTKEAQMLAVWSARHRRLVGRVGLVLLATLVTHLFGTWAPSAAAGLRQVDEVLRRAT